MIVFVAEFIGICVSAHIFIDYDILEFYTDYGILYDPYFEFIFFAGKLGGKFVFAECKMMRILVYVVTQRLVHAGHNFGAVAGLL